MKSILALVGSLVFSFTIAAQSIPCDAFCVKAITMDTTQKGYLLAHIEFTSDTVAFVNYPHVRAITDLNGDTIATGTLSFFGQFYNTTQEYPAETNLDAIPEGFVGNVHFYYDQDSCILSFPCGTTQLKDEKQLTGVTVFPNPATTYWQIKSEAMFENLSVEITDVTGKVVLTKDNIHGQIAMMDREQLPAGIYAVRLRDRGLTTVEKIILQ